MKLLAVLALGGCLSFAVVDKPQPPPRHPDCTESFAAPVFDSAASALLLGVTAAAIHAERTDEEWIKPGAALIVVLSAHALLTGASAVYGFHRVSQCQDATTRYEQSKPVAR